MSQNLYWLGADSTSYRELTHLAPTLLKASASSARVGDMVRVKVELSNTTATSSLANKLTLLNAGDKTRILPAYFTDNYISLLLGEMRTVEFEYLQRCRRASRRSRFAVGTRPRRVSRYRLGGELRRNIVGDSVLLLLTRERLALS